jgi:hypothetical protein
MIWMIAPRRADPAIMSSFCCSLAVALCYPCIDRPGGLNLSLDSQYLDRSASTTSV